MLALNFNLPAVGLQQSEVFAFARKVHFVHVLPIQTCLGKAGLQLLNCSLKVPIPAAVPPAGPLLQAQGCGSVRAL